jgi:hypothetical protein
VARPVVEVAQRPLQLSVADVHGVTIAARRA